MRVVRSIKAGAGKQLAEVVGKLLGALQELLPEHGSGQQPQLQGGAAAAGAGGSLGATPDAADAAAANACGRDGGSSGAGASSAGNPSTSSRSTEWDPPAGALAKPGAKRMFPGRGRGIYWPRMPCLHCGCPWWQGEDWDAQCMR